MRGWTQAVAFDYDGTLAVHDHISDETCAALAEARAGGLVLILVTGRRASALHLVFPQSDSLFDAVVSENGAMLSIGGSVLRLGPLVKDELCVRLTELGIEYEVGDCILDCDGAHVGAVSELINDLELDLQVLANRGRLMVLPAGVTKATGLEAALYQLGLSPHNVIAVGDAENDIDMLGAVEVGVAVANALDSVKACADVVLKRPGVQGVVEVLRGPVLGDWGSLTPPKPRTMQIGEFADGSAVSVPGSWANILIKGETTAGKSTLAGLLVEGWTRRGYRVLTVDAEGDHLGLGELPGVVVLSAQELPTENVLATLMRWGGLSVVLDLSTMDAASTRDYLAELPGMISRLRADCGMPHWVMLDEAHISLGKGGTMERALRPGDHGYALVTYHPADLAKLHTPDFDVVLTALAGKPNDRRRVMISDAQHHETPFLPDDRRTPHVRHWHKYAAATLPENHWFWFSTPDGVVTTVARNVDEFAADVANAPRPVIEHHLSAGDFSRWLRGMKSQDLAERVLDVEVGFQQHRLTAEQARHMVLTHFTSLFGLDNPANPAA